MTNPISRRDFLKGAASAVGVSALGMFTSTAAFADESSAFFAPGTYTSIQTTPYATIEVKVTFSANAITDVNYDVLSSSKGDYFNVFKAPIAAYCERIVAAGKAEGVDGVSGATFCGEAIKAGVNECTAKALGIHFETKKNDNPQVSGYDTFDGDCAAVFSPVKLGTMELPNRVIKSAGSGPWADSTGSKIPTSIDLYGQMAANGVSLIIMPGAPGDFGVSPDSLEIKDSSFEAELPKLTPFVDAVHANGAKVGFQIFFGGFNPVVPDSLINETPVEELDAFIDRVGISAERAKIAGFDCLEIKGASADGLNGFLTRRVNRREDEYGCQNIENRTRLFRRMIEKIKEVNGKDFPVGVLINAVEENDASLGSNELFLCIEETKEIAKALEAAGADWIQVRVGANGQEMNIWAPDVQHCLDEEDGLTGYGNKFDYESHFGGLIDGSKSGFASFLPCVKAIKEAVSVPVGCAAYMDLRVGPDYLNNAIANGDLDLIFMNRPLNCDPTMVNKIKEGRREDVRPCMKCMHCHDSIGSGRKYKSSCRMNAASYTAYTERMPEGMIPVPAETPKTLMVIGAGPAGLEAARVAAERGHKVVVYDKADKIGGRMQFARGVKGDHERFEDTFKYYEAQLSKAGVEVNLFKNVTVDTVKEVNPDAVFVATGAVLADSGLTASADVMILTPEQAFSASTVGEKVVIVGSNVQAVDFAAYLTVRGKKVTLINELDASECDRGQAGWFKTYIMAHLQSKGTKFMHNAAVTTVADGGVKVLSDAGYETFVKCDTVIEFNLAPNTALADEIAAAGYEVTSIGDCAAPFNIQRAISAGNLAARAL